MDKELEFLIDGQRVPGDEAWVREHFPDAAEGIIEEAKAFRQTGEYRQAVRRKIGHSVGDTETILGTVSDVTQLNAAAILALIAAVKSGETYEDFRQQFMGRIEALVPARDSLDVYDQAEGFLTAIQSGEVVLTAALKGLPAVISEMSERSTGVAKILMSMAEQAALHAPD